MAKSCLYSPVDKNKKPYKALPEYRTAFGMEAGTDAFLKALSPSFQKRHEGKLKIDDQGVATLETAVKIPEMKELIGFKAMKNKLEKEYKFKEVSNTADNFRMLVNEAKVFNDQNEDYIAYPEKTENGIRNVVHKKDNNSVNTFNNMYGSMALNDRLLSIFEPLGLKISDLLEAEKGYTGITDFANARITAEGFINIIRVANNMGGQLALSEEMSHLIVRMFKDKQNLQRLISAFAANQAAIQAVLGDDYSLYVEQLSDNEGNVNYDEIAEEAVGRLLQGKLQEEVMKDLNTSYIGKLWHRFLAYLKRTFQEYNASDVEQALIDADQTLGTLAKNILKGSVGITREDIESTTDNNEKFSTENNDTMYHLEKDFDELDKIIEDRINVETKKTKIIKSDKAVEAANRKIKNLEAIQDGTPEGKLKGIINYAHNAVKDLGAAREALGNSKSGERNFAMLRGIRATIQSYDDFIRQISALINTKDEDLIKLIMDTEIEDKHHTIVKMKQAYDELSSLYNLVKEDFKSVLLDSVEEFFTPFFDVKDGKFVDGSGKERTLRELIQEANGDISFTDRYLMTMSSSGDLLLQLFDAVVGQAKAHARYKTIDDINEIVRIMLNAEEKGVTEFDWIYEKDSDGRKTGNYISEINTGQFEKDKQEFLRQLEEEYGANPTGEKAKEKKAKRKAWMSSHGKNHGVKPNEVMYRNSEFDKLTTAQKEVLNDIMRLKQKFDRRLPSNKVSTTRAIQMRRTSQQRLLNSLSNPEQAFKNIQESIAKEFTLSTDDDQIYGEKTGLRSFDGSEFKVLPALYTTRLSNPDELTSDIFSALAAYSYSTNIYEEMDAIVDPLELAKAWVKEGREVREMANGKELVEKVNGIVNPILKKGGSNIVDKLEDFMDSQVYSRYYADSDKTINVMGKELKAGKIVNKWMSLSSAVQLGFNALSQLGNAATGIAMQNIEAFCGHYFNAKELLKADGAYLNELPKFISEVESRNPTGKLALFDQLFDIKQEFADNTKRRMNTLFEKLFGNTVAYLGQTCGDHWLYNRTAIAMCQRKKVRLSDGTITSLWDALKVVDAFEGDSRIKKLAIDAVDAETGQIIDLDYIHEYSDKINKINHRLFGVYNTDDMVAAQRVALGRAVLQYRQWMVPMFARRFQAREYNLSLGEYEEGYYRTLLRVVAGLRGGMHGVMEVWDELDEAGKRNVYRSLIEMSQFMLIWAIANFVQFGKGDPDRNWGMKLAEYMAQRELHELGNLTPSFTMGNEILKTVKSPATILNTTQAAMNLAASLLDPRDWNDEIESGKYEGMSTLHKNILKAPFPILAPFNQLDRFTDSLEEVTRYYARPQ